MLVLLMIFMMTFGFSASLTGPIQISETFKPYAALIETLYGSQDLTFEQDRCIVAPHAEELYTIWEDPISYDRLFLEKQKVFFKKKKENKEH